MPQDFDRLITSSLTRRIFLASGMMGLLQSKFSWAQSDTSSVSRLVVPFEPGGISDSLGRAVAAGLKRQNSRSWVVENIPGAGGAIGAMRAHGQKLVPQWNGASFDVRPSSHRRWRAVPLRRTCRRP